ncbi:hypothetical protein [uncultured Roseobacter sp.]|uniref:hypothetical protein n=1 Tax=uncultured Roseobacter sp. TaxID=114847 RepID=UPI0026158DAF|nr:hypothetical protein [uncultured Roseobacter sp.]
MKFPTRLPFFLRSQWDISAERLADEVINWRETVFFATKHGCTPPLPEEIPGEVLEAWQQIRREEYVNFDRQWEAVHAYAEANGYELSVEPEPTPDDW